MKIFPMIQNMEAQEIIKNEADYFKFDIGEIKQKFIPFQVNN